jgi:RhoGAP domain
VDIHAICATVKGFLRLLPDPLIPFRYHGAAVACAGMIISLLCGDNSDWIAGVKDYVERLNRIRTLVHSLPPAHFYTLHRLIQHLDRWAF